MEYWKVCLGAIERGGGRIEGAKKGKMRAKIYVSRETLGFEQNVLRETKTSKLPLFSGNVEG